MNVAELLNRLDREHARIKERFNETDYDQGYLRGLEKAMNMTKQYMDEMIERMAEQEHEVYMEECATEADR